MRLLIVGSLGGQVGAASRIAKQRGADVLHADDLETVLHLARSGRRIDLLLVDCGLDIAVLVARLAAERITLPVVACGVGSDARAAVAAIKAGAKEYLPLPPDPELIAALLAAVTQDACHIIHADPRMADVVAMAARVAASEASVLILGESGTGKEVLARFLHARSRRAQAAFVAVNCAAIPEQLLESELFGHEKGAFTGAVARRIGRFEEAHGGTLLLDEISEMDPRLQAKLLRAIQEREIARVGGGTPIKVDVRIIATSNRDLDHEVACQRFRRDLYFRLNVVTLRLPSLAQRPKDIPLLAAHFIDKYARANGLSPRHLSAAAEAALLRYAWPGNVRELENTMHRAVVLSTGPEITADDLLPAPAPATRPAGTMPLADAAAPRIGQTVAAVERDLIIGTLRHCLGNRTHAATILGISIRTLRNKLKQYADEGTEIPPPAAGGSGELLAAAIGGR